MRQEGLDQMGNIPTVFTETGMPMDMNAKKAYETGDYSSQVAALDAVHFGIEGSGMQGYTLWNYTGTVRGFYFYFPTAVCLTTHTTDKKATTQNTHEWGDEWNGEDLSIFAQSDPTPPILLLSHPSSTSIDSPSFSASSVSATHTSETPSSLKQTLSSTTSSSMTTTTTTAAAAQQSSYSSSGAATPTLSTRSAFGFRAASAHIRPWPIAVHGAIGSFAFDLKTCSFSLSLVAPAPTPESAPTLVALPDWHFPPGFTRVDVSGGRWAVVSEAVVTADAGENDDGPEAEAEAGAAAQVQVQVLRWWHGEGEQRISVVGMVRKMGTVDGDGEEELGYLEQCRAQGSSCCVM
jgi:hypothetical protein